MSPQFTVYIMALVSVTLWGASFPLTKAALDTVGPTSLAFLRWAISALALTGWLAWRGRNRSSRNSDIVSGFPTAGKLLKHDWRAVTWVALSGITLFYWFENTALRYTTAINAGVLSNLTAIFMVLIAIIVLGERLRALEWVALVVAFTGAVLVSQGAGHLRMGGTGLIGDLLMVAASLFAAIYSIGGKRLAERYSAAAVTTVVATVGALFLLPLALFEGLHFDLPLPTWGIILLLGLGAGALANVWWLAILAHMKASRAALVLFLIPIISAALAVAMLGEPLTPTIMMGTLLVLLGVLTVQRKAG